jgi:hypothetical protein
MEVRNCTDKLRSFTPFNAVLPVWNREIEQPPSVSKPGRTLHSLGRLWGAEQRRTTSSFGART